MGKQQRRQRCLFLFHILAPKSNEELFERFKSYYTDQTPAVDNVFASDVTNGVTSLVFGKSFLRQSSAVTFRHIYSAFTHERLTRKFDARFEAVEEVLNTIH